MKILMVNKFLYPNGGSETYIFKLGKCLTDMGHEVQYFGMEDERNIVENQSGMYTSNYNFHSSSLKKLLYPVKIIYSTEARKKIKAILHDFHPDVVHLNNINFQLTPSILYEIKKQGIPMVMTAHDYQLICPNHMMYIPQKQEICDKCLGGNYSNCTENHCIHNSKLKSYLGYIEARFYHKKKTYNLISKIICPSHFLEEKLMSDSTLAEKTCTLHNFVDIHESKEVVKKDYILYFGRYSIEKGIATLIQVCKQLPQIHFVFAGSGPEEDKLRDISNVNNVGFKNGTELEKLVREARCTIYPSEWYENCPFSIMESEMYGTPVIGANIGGIPELIQDGKTGLLFESGKADDLKEKIEKVWNDREYLEQLTTGCHSNEFDTVEEYCRKLINIYNELQ